MHLFAPERPELSSGIKCLLLDGSHVPHLLMSPEPDGMIKVSIMLRQHDEHGGYGWHSAKFPSCDIGDLLVYYTEDPELVLREYFDWIDQKPSRPNVRVPVTTVKSGAAGLSPMEDLI